MMHTRIPHLQLVIDRTPKRTRRRPIVIAVLLFIAAMTLAPFMIGCGGDTRMHGSGLVVIDPNSYMTDEQIQTIIDKLVTIAPVDDANKILPALMATTLTFVEAHHVDDCVDPDDIGCTTSSTHHPSPVITVAENGCTTAGIIAHEIGHAIGHSGHAYRPWFGSDGNYDTSMEARINLWWCTWGGGAPTD